MLGGGGVQCVCILHCCEVGVVLSLGKVGILNSEAACDVGL